MHRCTNIRNVFTTTKAISRGERGKERERDSERKREKGIKLTDIILNQPLIRNDE
jgi:hypothetical protein